MPPVDHLLRLIAILFAALMAPKGTMKCVRGMDLEALWNLAGNLEFLWARGRRLRYPGESLAMVAARIELIVWIARTPSKAYRHLALQLRGWKRGRAGAVTPPAFTPPRLALTLLPAPATAACFADSS